ncbi:MAG: ACT domain-containing protein [Merdibacter sp.]|mgnify:FL=1|nr:ACT domain-containing protein [Merdibacter sp.]HIY89761.1 ACT domain-containing protein [Candidatus Merdibacter merdipullorum]
MAVRQISVFMENKVGPLAEITTLLAQHQINMRALSVAETQDFGILRIIVEEPEKAEQVLKDNQIIFRESSVLAVLMEDRPGSMAAVVDLLAQAGIPVEYAYAFITRQADNACLILKVKEDEAAEALLEKEGVRSLSEQELNTL